VSNETITLIIQFFNITAATVMGFFAICGALAQIFKKSRLNIFRGRMFVQTFCIAALTAFGLEATAFNYKHFLKYYAGGELCTTEISPADSTVILTTDPAVLARISDHTDNGRIAGTGVFFSNLDRRITSVHVKPVFSNTNKMEMHIRWTDEGNTHSLTKWFYKGLPHENYTAIQPYGKISKLEFFFSEGGISQIALNRQIPFYLNGLRLMAVAVLFFAILLLLNKNIRTETANLLFEYRFDPANKKQNLIYALTVISLIIFSWFCAATSTSYLQDTPMNRQYNEFLVDALIAGRTYLDYGNPEMLLNAERPYDFRWLTENRYEWYWDISHYKGKYYCYYGIVPVVFLYLPYKLITGNYLSHNTSVFLFASIAIILLAALWRFLVRKYMPDSKFVFYLLSLVTLFFASHMFAALRYPTVYTVVQISGLTFAAAGVLLILKSADSGIKVNYPKLFLACLCLALAVGCRPNMLFVSLLVPIVLWKYKTWKLALFALLPYIMVAIPMCLYNYGRFDSIFEFGHQYVVGVGNGAAGYLNPFAKIHRALITLTFYLFRPYEYSLHFPFVELIPTAGGITTTALGFLMLYNGGAGLINFPIVFCLFYLFKIIPGKNRPQGFYLLPALLIIAAIMLVHFSLMGVFHGRYLLDCMIFIVFPSLFCAYYWLNSPNSIPKNHTKQKIVYAMLAASIFTGLFLFASWGDIGMHNYGDCGDPALYRYIESSLGLIERIY